MLAKFFAFLIAPMLALAVSNANCSVTPSAIASPAPTPTATPTQGAKYQIGLGIWNNCQGSADASNNCNVALTGTPFNGLVAKAYVSVDDMESIMEAAQPAQATPLIRYGLSYDQLSDHYPSGPTGTENELCGTSVPSGTCETLNYFAGRTTVVSYFGQGGSQSSIEEVYNEYELFGIGPCSNAAYPTGCPDLNSFRKRADNYVDAYEGFDLTQPSRANAYTSCTVSGLMTPCPHPTFANPYGLPTVVRLWWEFNGSGGNDNTGCTSPTVPANCNFNVSFTGFTAVTNNEIVSYCATYYSNDGTCTPARVVTYFWCGSLGPDDVGSTRQTLAYYNRWPGNAALVSPGNVPAGGTVTDNPGMVGGDAYDRYGKGFVATTSDGYALIVNGGNPLAGGGSCPPYNGCIALTTPVGWGETGAMWGSDKTSTPPCNPKNQPSPSPPDNSQGGYFGDFGSKQSTILGLQPRDVLIDLFSSDIDAGHGITNCWGLLEHTSDASPQPYVDNIARNFYHT